MTPLPPKILIVEDEPELREATTTFLNLDGLVADGVGSLGAATTWLETHEVDILVLDLGLPDGDALSWFQRQSKLKNKGLVITTARGHSSDRIQGARHGADVYLVKPIALEELSLLLLNLRKRLALQADAVAWQLNRKAWELQAPNGLCIDLTRNEMLLMEAISESDRQEVSREDLAKRLGHDLEHFDWRRVEIMVRRFRNKAVDHLGHSLPLKTIHGYGFVFTEALKRDDPSLQR